MNHDDLDAELRRRYAAEKPLIQRLEAAGASTGELADLRLLTRMNEKGLEAVLLARRSAESRAEAEELAKQFVLTGPKAVLRAGAQRGGDFLNNQLRGQWAERVVLSMALDGMAIVAFGPSGSAMPGEQDHHDIVANFRLIKLLEGKRPDLLAFDASIWPALSAPLAVESWPNRVLAVEDDEVVRKALFGIEVKNSTWHYANRRAAGGGPLSITVKDEELAEIEGWITKTGRPLLFFQVLFDEIYCMSFRRMRDAVRAGQVYRHGDYEKDVDTGADRKVFHRFHLDDFSHKCGIVVFPDESLAHVRILPDGSVIPHLELQPARALDASSAVIRRELAYKAT